VDTILTMRRRDDGVRTIGSVQRYGTDLEETVIDLKEDGLVTTEGLLAKRDQEAAKDRLIAFLKGNPGTDREGIKEGVEGRWAIVQAALSELVKTGGLRRDGSGKKGDPFKYYFSGSHGSQELREPENGNSRDMPSVPHSASREIATEAF